jgi:hypothetical protein
LGGRSEAYNVALSAIISGQVDADKLDYMQRDALSSGMPIAFDTARLIAKLNIVKCTPDNLPPARTPEDTKKIEFARNCADQHYVDVGIEPSGVGALEQMLVGRAFLYDRLYYHHKVRAADAMSQRLLVYAGKARTTGYRLTDLYLDVADDTLMRILGGMLTGPLSDTASSPEAYGLASSILGRRLFHRALAFRARFHHTAESFSTPEQEMDFLAGIWSPLSSELSEFDKRLSFEDEVFEEAKRLGAALGVPNVVDLSKTLERWHVIVDLPDNRIKPVSMYVQTEGQLELPNLFFDPSRWSDVYNLEKRTGYIFCPPRFVPLVSLAGRVLLYRKWGYIASARADMLTKMTNLIPADWYEQLVRANHLRADEARFLQHKDILRIRIRPEEIKTPEEWAGVDPPVATKITAGLRAALPSGIAVEDANTLKATLSALTGYVQKRAMNPIWRDLERISETKVLQKDVLDHLLTLQLTAVEGTELAGGETDIIVQNTLLIENKVSGKTADPFEVLTDAPYQANRYSGALSKAVFCTVVAYKPADEDSLVPPSNSIRVLAHFIAGFRVAEVRVVVPYGQGIPSRARRPRKPV